MFLFGVLFGASFFALITKVCYIDGRDELFTPIMAVFLIMFIIFDIKYLKMVHKK